MDFKLIVIDAVIGGAGGAVGGLIGAVVGKVRGSDPRSGKNASAILVFPGVLAGALATILHWDVAIAAKLFPANERDAITEKYGKQIVDDPAFPAYIRGKTDVEGAAAQLAARGMHRLDVSQIRVAATVRLTLAKQSPAVCSGMWTGKADGRAIGLAVDSLPLPEYERFLQVTTTASLRELRGEGTVFAPPADAGPALDAAVGVLGDRGAELTRIMGEGLSASEADGCAGVKLLYEAIGKLPDDRAREVFAIATQ